MSRRLSEGLDQVDGRIACRACGHDFGPAGRSWKPAARLLERPMAGAGGIAYSARQDVLLRRFCCPGCGALLDTETALSGDPFLDDVVEV